MPTYILIWWIAFGGALAGGQQEFDSEVKCRSAYAHMATVVKPGSTTLHGVCVPKGDKQ
jgi:hypothetical protein